MNHISLFSGIGGFDLAAEWMGWHNVAHCDINQFCQKILKYYWPQADSYSDITQTDFTKYEGLIDILTGGFPCQPYSVSGSRKGTADARHLWPEMCRAINEIKPGWVVGENVRGLISWNKGLVFDEVQSDLEAQGYELFPVVLPAAGINAPHKRERIWFIAYSESRRDRIIRNRLQTEGARCSNQTQPTGGSTIFSTNTASYRGDQDYRFGKSGLLNKESPYAYWGNFPTQPPVCNGDDGFPAGMDAMAFSRWRNKSIQGGGNAIVPQVAYQIFRTIELYDLLY